MFIFDDNKEWQDNGASNMRESYIMFCPGETNGETSFLMMMTGSVSRDRVFVWAYVFIHQSSCKYHNDKNSHGRRIQEKTGTI